MNTFTITNKTENTTETFTYETYTECERAINNALKALENLGYEVSMGEWWGEWDGTYIAEKVGYPTWVINTQ